MHDLETDRKYTAKYAERFLSEITEYTPKLSAVPQDTNGEYTGSVCSVSSAA